MEIEDRIKIAALLSEYGGLLTEKQRKMLSDYVELDMSLFEIAEEAGVTRQAVRDAVKHAVWSLEKAEAAVGKIAWKSRVAAALDEVSAGDEELKAKLKKVYESLEG